ncbi:hypothetical protein SLS57_004149 [Botryosphaeria dothidea]
MAVWGIYPKDVNDPNIRDHEIPVCVRRAGIRAEGYQHVADRLGVLHSGVGVPADSGDWGGISDDLLMECGTPSTKQLSIRGHGPIIRSTDDDAIFSAKCAASLPSAVTIDTITVSLPPSDFGLTPFPSVTTATSCSMQRQDPNEGIPSAYCVCDKSVSLPLQSTPSATVFSQSCQYTALPTATSAQASPTTTLGPATTDTKLCQICTPIVNNADACVSMSHCIPQTAAVTVEAGSSPVHVGTLTGTALYTSVSHALESLCPEATQTISMTACATGAVKIDNVPYVDGGLLARTGELVVRVASSQYNATSLRNAMIRSAALTAQQAAAGKNCYNQTYEVAPLRRRGEESVAPWSPRRWAPQMFAKRDVPKPCWNMRPGATPSALRACSISILTGASSPSQARQTG